MAAKIVILGGGFGGVATARRLERVLRPDEADITLVSRDNYSIFTPMLPEVSAGGIETRHILTPVRAELRRSQFVLAVLTKIDLEARRVDYEHTITGARGSLNYDHLVIGVGAVTSTFNLPGVAEHSLPLKSLEDAETLRNHIIATLELADVTSDPVERKRLLTYVFVGGGYTGVEAAGELLDFFKSINRFYHSVQPSEVSIVLVEGGARLLPTMPESMGAYTGKNLARRGVVVETGVNVASAESGALILADGRRIESRTMVWTAGVRPSPLVAALAVQKQRNGSIVTGTDMSIPGRPGVWAIGDCASIPMEDGTSYPMTAQHAIREGPVLADNIAATLRGGQTRPFRYTSLGTMASLGAHRGIAGLPGGFVLKGFPAWFLWRSYYLSRLPGLDRRFRVAVDWTLGVFFPRDIAELRVYTERSRAMASAESGMKTADALTDQATHGSSEPAYTLP